MLATIAVVLLVTGSSAVQPATSLEPSTRLNGLTRSLRDFVVEHDQGDPDHDTIDAQFRLDSGEPGVVRVDFSNGENPGVESEFSVSGVPHVWLRQVEGEEPEVWLSPDIKGDPELMGVYWAVITDLAIYESTAANPACKYFKNGLRLLAWIATRACPGWGPAALACVAGAYGVDTAARQIDCNKECKPDCPIP